MIPDHAPFGEAADGPLPEAMVNISGTGMAIGLPYEALRAFALMRALDYLVTREDVDPERIGIAGLCQGSIDPWWAATFEPRFKVIGPTCGTTTYEAWARAYVNFGNLSDVSPYRPNILSVCDTQHIYASWVPRPVLIQSNVNDNWWPLSGFDRVVNLSRQVYGLYGRPERFEAHLDNEVHDITPLFESRLLSFFKMWLSDGLAGTP